MGEYQPYLFSDKELEVLTSEPFKKIRESTSSMASRVDAKQMNLAFIKKTDKRVLKDDAVLAPCMKEYLAQFARPYQTIELLSNLTGPLIRAFDSTKAVIEKNMYSRWNGDTEKISRSIPNSLKRSAGTNYQTLVSYALARFLVESDSAWYLSYPVPKEFKQALAITFTAGIPIQPEEEIFIEANQDNRENNSTREDITSSVVKVQPDVDILLRNANWQSSSQEAEPVIMLSLKTSLVDRAGMAARWKIYFDLATHPCNHQNEEDCAYKQLGIQMDNAKRYDIHHGIVTANIYKLNFHDPRYHKGELTSGQTQSNTYMFDLKLTTRDDDEAITPITWKQFPYIVKILEDLSTKHHLAV